MPVLLVPVAVGAAEEAAAAVAAVAEAIASARPCAVEPVTRRREAADPRVGESRAGASLGRRDPDRPVTPAITGITSIDRYLLRTK